MNIRISLALCGIVLLSFFSCSEEGGTPKPRIYPKVFYPERGDYERIQPEDCPLSFEIPAYTAVERDSRYHQFNPAHPCWFNIHYPMFQANVYCSYVPLDGMADFDGYKSDAFEITDQINKRSDFMEEIPYENSEGVGGMVFDFRGPAASPMQFFLSDSSRHFFKGALYYNTQNEPDSLGPVSRFIKKDIERMLSSFRWEGGEG